MSSIQSLSLTGAGAVAFLAYLAVGLPIALWGQLEPTVAQTAISLLVPAPIFLFFCARIWLEWRSGRRIVPRLRPCSATRTHAQAHTETRGNLLTLGFAAFVCLAPLALWFSSGKVFSIMPIAPLLCWGWISHVFGLTRLRLASIMMTRSGSEVSFTTDEICGFLTGLVIARGHAPGATWGISVRSEVREGVPTLVINGKSEDPDDEPLAAGEDAPLALMVLATGNGDPYRLIHSTGVVLRIAPMELCAHVHMGAMKTFMDAVNRLPDILVR